MRRKISICHICRQKLLGSNCKKKWKANEAKFWSLAVGVISENQSQVRRPHLVQPSRKRRQVPREEWIEEESTHDETAQTEVGQSEQVRQHEAERQQPEQEQQEEAHTPITQQQEEQSTRTDQEQSTPVNKKNTTTRIGTGRHIATGTVETEKNETKGKQEISTRKRRAGTKEAANK